MGAAQTLNGTRTASSNQFLNKNIGDDMNKVYLDAFGLIAKEGRKYGLTCA
jgi:uncharacterized protein